MTRHDRLVALLAAGLRRVARLMPERARTRLYESRIEGYMGWRRLPLDFRTAEGLRIRGDMRDFHVRRLYFEVPFEPGLMRLLRARLRPGDGFVDVGANIGYVSLVASRLVGPEGAVWAFEASPTIFARLRDTLADNGATNIMARNIAISDRARRLPIFLSEVSPAFTTTVNDPEQLAIRGAALEAEVDALPLSEAVPAETLARTALVKIDVEGAEADVLAGLAPALDRMRPDLAIALELTIPALERAGRSVEGVLAPFVARGFRTFSQPDENGRLAPLPDLRAACSDWGVVDLVLVTDAGLASLARP